MSDWLERYKGHLALLLLAAIVVGGAVFWARRPPEHELVITPPKGGEATRRITIDIDGAVARPGLYALADGSRVADAIDAAGGPTEDADLSRINRATRLKDEQQVRVPRLATPVAVPAGQRPNSVVDGSPDGGLIDLNSAALAQLDTLPGVGPVTAQRILDHRERNGPFDRIEQLKEAKLVNASTFERIKDLVYVR